jgi:phage FluMu protein gp41
MSLTITKSLPFNWKVGGKEVREIEVRPSTMEDVCDAEREQSPMQPNAFNLQMACRQIVRAGEFTGPFVVSHFKALRPHQFGVIAQAMSEADALGEA